jgi:Zn-dependent metalloprotease
MKKTFLIFACLFAYTFGVEAQKIQEAQWRNNQTLDYAIFNTDETNYSAKQSEEIFRNILKVPKDVTFVHYETTSDEYGFTHDKYEQYFKGIKVEHTVFYIHAKNGVVKYINGDYSLINLTSVSPKLTEKEALALVLDNIGAKQYAWENEQSEKFVKELRNDDKASYFPKGELLIRKDFDLMDKTGEEIHHLAYKFSITATIPDLHQTIYIDAQTGVIFNVRNNECSIGGDVATRYNGIQNIVNYTTRRADGKYILQGNGVSTKNLLLGEDITTAVDFEDNNNEWTAIEHNNVMKDNIALSAQWAGSLSKKY